MKFNNFSNGVNFIIIATIISIVIAQILDDDEQNVLGNFLQSVGTNLSAIAAFDEYIESKAKDDKDNKELGKC
jgi:hypothetical protein